MFTETIYLRLGVGISSVVMISLYKFIANGFMIYDVFGGLFEIIFVPVMIFLMSFAFEKSKRFTHLYEIGAAAIIFAAVYSLKEFHLLGFSVATVASFIITLYISRDGGVLRGGMAGIICGMACETKYAPVFALCGITGGLLWKMG